MSKLPSTWIDVEIGEIAEVMGGGTPKANDVENFTAPGEGIAWLTPADLSGYKRKEIAFGARDLTLEGYKSCSAKLMPKGSLLFSSRAPIGYVAVAANEIATNQGFKSFVLSHGIDPSYAFYYLKSIRQLADSLGTGTTFKEISGATAKTLPFRLAPTAEQTRIAAKLDELLAQVDTLKVRIDGIPALLKRFRQSVLAAAVSGRLTKEWRVAVHETSQDQGFLYPVRRLGVIARFIDYRGKTPEKVDSGVPLITAKNIKSGYISRVPREFIRPEAYESWMTRGIPKVGDVLITTEAPLGNVAVIDITEKFALAQRAICLQFHEGYSSSFAAIALQSSLLQEELARRSTGTTVKGIKASVLKEIGLPAPSIDEQNEIVHRVEQLFAYAEQLETKVSEAKKRIDHLAQSILAKAFKGDLVPQDPNDEPADVLLEHIKAQRTAAPKAKRSRRSATAD